ncbi:MAG: HAD-IA family hydrolase [Thermodesulfobacteriota bacterium]|nr:HAD-IA family hydrolase [Thermodesulfobacteriota bacterium]
MDIKAFLFDLDGTLVDSSRDLANTVNRLRQHLDLPALAVETALSFVGDGTTKLVQRALPDGIYRPEHLQLFLQLYSDHLIEHSACYPGIREFLAQHHTTALAVVTNKPYQLAIDLLQGLDLFEPFSFIVGGDSLAEKKPHPLPIFHTLQQLDIAPANCVMIGDHHTDLRSAEAAGVSSCFCHYGFGHTDAVPSTWSVTSAHELLTLFP